MNEYYDLKNTSSIDSTPPDVKQFSGGPWSSFIALVLKDSSFRKHMDVLSFRNTANVC